MLTRKVCFVKIFVVFLYLLSEGRWNYRRIPTMIYPRNQFDRAQAELETKFGHHIHVLQ